MGQDPEDVAGFQFLGIPPKGERQDLNLFPCDPSQGFQFLGIPPKGEPLTQFFFYPAQLLKFPISRDPPEGGTE